jgi:hypothetical protein
MPILEAKVGMYIPIGTQNLGSVFQGNANRIFSFVINNQAQPAWIPQAVVFLAVQTYGGGVIDWWLHDPDGIRWEIISIRLKRPTLRHQVPDCVRQGQGDSHADGDGTRLEPANVQKNHARVRRIRFSSLCSKASRSALRSVSTGRVQRDLAGQSFIRLLRPSALRGGRSGVVRGRTLVCGIWLRSRPALLPAIPRPGCLLCASSRVRE